MKYFVVSDVHSCYTPLMNALNECGYSKFDKDHTLIVCGDLFDRGYETNELLEFIKSIPKTNRILIRGNHEFLLRELYERGEVLDHDVHNGTNKTCAQLMHTNTETVPLYISIGYNGSESDAVKDVVDWIFDSDEWVNYYEIGNYIFVHSFIPLKYKEFDEWDFDAMFDHNSFMEYDPNWRNASLGKWEKASWGCPYEQYEKYFTEEKNSGKILVYGHWHTWRIREHYFGKSKELCHDIFTQDNQIALDACTPYSNKVNIFVFEN